jgi:hypothetical protein
LNRLKPRGVVGEGATGETGDTGESVADTFDRAERGGRCTESAGEQRWEQGGGDLMADVGEEAGTADALDARGKPLVGSGGDVFVGVSHDSAGSGSVMPLV